MNNDIIAYLAQSNYKEILTKLVQTNTTNLPGNEMDAVNAILSFFPKEKTNYEIIDHGNHRGSLVITIHGKVEKPSLAFVGHIDTVPVSDAEEWKHDPFAAVIDEEGNLHGRGAADMKGGVTAMITTALYFITKNITPVKTLKFCFTADEESGGMGAIALKEKGYLDDAEAMIIPEPTTEGIGICEKGALWLSVHVAGKSAHASRPDLGINALEKAQHFIEKLRQTTNMSFQDPLLGNSTFSITQLHAGVKTNIIPNEATATVDIRTTPDLNHDEIVANAEHLSKEMIEAQPGLDIQIEIENNRPPVLTAEDDSFVREIQQVYRELAYDPTVKGLQFYTDASQLIPELEIPFVILGPGKEEMAHQRDEYISLRSVEKVAGIFIIYLFGMEG